MMWTKWVSWALIVGVIISIIIAIVGWITAGPVANGLFGNGIISALSLHAMATFLAAWNKTMMKKHHKD